MFALSAVEKLIADLVSAFSLLNEKLVNETPSK